MAVSDRPILIKKVKKVGGHGHHGGAWKVAYADFVTAMMAFFLLMWLLGSTTEGDKKGIADFFQSPLKVAMFGGSGSGDASHIIKGGGQDLTRQTGQVKAGDVQSPRKTINLKALKEEQRRAERAAERPLLVWSHGDLPAARDLAERLGAERVRALGERRLLGERGLGHDSRPLPVPRVPRVAAGTIVAPVCRASHAAPWWADSTVPAPRVPSGKIPTT